MPFCVKCGREYQQGYYFCNVCGAALPQTANQSGVNQTPAAPNQMPVSVPNPAPARVSMPAQGGAPGQTAASVIQQPIVFCKSQDAVKEDKSRYISPIFFMIFGAVFASVILIYMNESYYWPLALERGNTTVQLLFGLGVICILVVIWNLVKLLYYLSHRNIVAQTPRVELITAGMNVYFCHSISSSLCSLQIPWQNIFLAQVDEHSRLWIKYRELNSSEIAQRCLMIENANACAAIIRQKAGL
ncbi:MAG: zinc ribbon domain-containing protein [Oscillospiraceae bacterium]|nr:zinc ribbon domain-containing protein [Oscillospiraceae bacterium]